MTTVVEPTSDDFQLTSSTTLGARAADWRAVELLLRLQEPVLTSPSSVSFAQTKPPEKLTEADFRELAVARPTLLVWVVQSGRLRPAQLATAATELGGIGRDFQAEQTLIELLTHEMPMVREGAVYGLARIRSTTARQALRQVVNEDMSPGVREAAEEALED